MKQVSLFVILLFSFLSTMHGQSVNYEPLYTASSFDAVTPDVNLAVGATNGSASVNSGVAGYTIPIATPPSTNDVAPSISLVYNSMAGNGIMGQGWNISGLSAISRTGHNMYFDGNVSPVQLTYENEDRFSLDGGRLIGIEGYYGDDGTKYGKESEDFSRITSHGKLGSGPLWFELVTKDGVIMQYGNTLDSRFLSEDGGNVLFWKLNRVIYRDGNYVDYKYKWMSATREQLIDVISFTGNVNTGLQPYNKVKFVYDERDDKNTVYLAGQRIGATQLLTKVQVLAVDDAAFRSYDLSYAYNGTTSYLTKITENGNDGSALNPTIFKYGEEASLSMEVMPDATSFGTLVVNELYVDYNLDGKSDLIGLNEQYTSGGYKYYPTIYFYKNVVSEGASEVNFQYDGYLNLPERAAVQIGDLSINSRQEFADFDGNSKPNIVVAELEAIDEVRNLKTVKIYEKNVVVAEFAEFAPNLLPYSGYMSVPKNGKPFMYSGDFDGNGKSEILFFLKPYIPNIDHGTSAPYLLTEHGWGDLSFLEVQDNDFPDIRIIDFDGDGKAELLVGDSQEAHIYSWNNYAFNFELVYSEPELKGMRPLQYLGDFNGDGKTDILYRDDEFDIASDWYILYSTGTIFEKKPFTFNHTPDVDDDYMGAQILIGDYNGDGRSDVAHGWNFNATTDNHVDIYFSQGENFVHLVDDEWPVTNSFQHFYKPSAYRVADLLGDGRSNICVARRQVLSIGSWSHEKLLEKVKTGLGAETEFEYKRMSDPQVYLQSALDVSYPFVNPAGSSMPLVYRYYKDMGPSNPKNEIKYKYHGGVYHKHGKGFRGFARINTHFVSDEKMTNDAFEINIWMKLYTQTVRYPYFGGWAVLTETKFNPYEVSLGDNRYFHKIIHKRVNNHFTDQYVDTHPIIDDNGNLKSNVIAKGPGSNSDFTVSNAVETTTTNITYKNENNLEFPSKPDVVEKTITRNGEISFTTKTKYQYTDKGQVWKVTNRFGQPKATTTEFLYTSLGNQYQATTLSSSGETLKYVHKVYDTKGRYAGEMKNILLQESFVNHDNVWGKPSYSKGVDGLERNFVYDGFGRIKTTELVDEGVTITDSWDWSAPGQDSKYYHLVTHPNKPDIEINYDHLGREVLKKQRGWENKWISEVTTYDELGRVKTKAAPSYDDETALVTSSLYDDFGRLEMVSNELGTTSYGYTFANSQMTTTITHPDGNTTSKTHDVSGKVIQSTDNGGSLDFIYASHGQVKTVKKGSTLLITNEYDEYGRQSKQIDMNAGTTEYPEYDDLDRLKTQINANGEVHTFEYDELGRIEKKTIPEGISTFTYYPANSGASTNQIKHEIGFAGNEIDYTYDTFGYPNTKEESIDGQVFLTDYTYDVFGKMTNIKYPSNFSLNYAYDANGYLETIIDNSNNSYFNNLGMNGYGQYTEFETGNKVHHIDEYYHGIPTNYKATNNSGTIVQDLSMNWNYTNGNLNSRTDAVKGKTESFVYDNLDRLISAQVLGETAQAVQFKTDGNMQYKSDAGLYLYSHPTKKNAVTSIWGVNEQNISHETQEIAYNSFLQPKHIQEIVDGTLHELEYVYDSDGQRLKSVLTVAGKVNTKYYLGDGCEKSGLWYDHYIFVGGRMIAMVKRLANTGTFGVEMYTFTDHLGSVVRVANEHGYPLYEQNFDAWGRNRNPNTWKYENIPVTYAYWKSSNRGFTGHEHLPNFKLINMNGRMYDPVVGRMLSTDNNIIGGYSTQGYDRYSYALNNPLKYTDPDGEHPLLFAGISVLVNGFGNYMNDKPFFQGALGAAIGGAFSGGVGGAVMSGLNQHLPSVNINLGSGANLSISPALSIGSTGAMLGINLGLSFQMSPGLTVGISASGMYGTNSVIGKTGFSSMIGGGLSYADGNNGYLSLTSMRYNGLGISQTTATFGVGWGNARIHYENDFMIGGVTKHLKIGDGGDRWRTAAMNISVGGAGLGFNLFTGDPGLISEERDSEELYDKGVTRDTYIEKEGDKAPRLGAVYLFQGDIRYGLDSERARHFIQNEFAHDALKGSPYWFRSLSTKVRPYGGIYKTSNYSLWH